MRVSNSYAHLCASCMLPSIDLHLKWLSNIRYSRSSSHCYCNIDVFSLELGLQRLYSTTPWHPEKKIRILFKLEEFITFILFWLRKFHPVVIWSIHFPVHYYINGSKYMSTFSVILLFLVKCVLKSVSYVFVTLDSILNYTYMRQQKDSVFEYVSITTDTVFAYGNMLSRIFTKSFSALSISERNPLFIRRHSLKVHRRICSVPKTLVLFTK